MPSFRFYILVFLLLLSSCRPQQEEAPLYTLFRALPAEKTHITFANELKETESWNIIQYLYFYNGGGVAVGDINNDGLPDIYFTANMQPNRLYLNKGRLEFEDITNQAYVAGQGNWKTGVTMADVNGDGWLDIYVCQVGNYKDRRGRNELYINQQDGTFLEAAEAYGLDFVGFSNQAAFFDYDRDGDLDLYLLNHSVHAAENYAEATIRNLPDEMAGDRLYRNDGLPPPEGEGLGFTDVTKEAGIYSSRVGYGLGIALSDVNGDGWPDLYVSNDFHENDYLYINQQDGTFRDATTESLAHTSTFSMGSDIADFNNDGRTDILSLDMKPEEETILKSSVGPDPFNIYQFKLKFGYHYQFPRNMLQLNQGELQGQTRFSEIGQLAGLSSTDWSWTPLIVDLDNDGWKDIFISNGIWRRPNDLDYLKFTSNQQVQQEASGLELASYMPPGKVPNYAFRNRHNLTFEENSKAWGLDYAGCTNAAAYADLDGDGDLDLITNNLNAEAIVFESRVQEQAGRHYLRLRLRAGGRNTYGIGSRVKVFLPGRTQTQELFTSRGFQSSVEPILTFGLGDVEKVDSIEIRWPDGSRRLLREVSADQTLEIRKSSEEEPVPDSPRPKPLFSDISSRAGIGFRHQENTFNDFDREKLLPHQLSTQGPCLAVADVNGDGWEDFFIGGAYGQAGELYLQGRNGSFRPLSQAGLAGGELHEDIDAAFFDANGDGLPDLYVVSGGGQAGRSTSLQDRLYLNQGQGRFALAADALPPIAANGACVVPLDFDRDGDMDLFIGSRSVPGSYGLPPRSYLLQNNGRGKFTDITMVVAPQLAELGMITDARLLSDGASQWLAVVGEWMPLMLFSPGEKEWAKAEAPQSNGWWNSINAADLDGDGDEDLLLGNLGLNADIKASPEEPVELFVKDFDNNGTTDPILTYYKQGKRYTYATKDELVEQLATLKKRFLDYGPFAKSTFEEVFPPGMREGAVHLQAFTLASCWAENLGNGQFELHELPMPAQFSPLFSLTAGDFNSDGQQDILGVGNWHGVRPSLGRYDASYGLFLRGMSQGRFTAVEPAQSGFAVLGQGRSIAPLRRADGRLLLIVARNDEAPVVFEASEVEAVEQPLR